MPSRILSARAPLWWLGTLVLAGFMFVLGAWTAPSAHAGTGGRKEFDESDGSTDPRDRELPRRHRFRLALHADWIRLSLAKNESRGITQRFHYAPLMIDLGYQLQFGRYFMLRPAVALGGNVANSRNAMPVALEPQLYLGYQGKLLGVAAGYAYLLAFPALKDAYDGREQSIGQPIILNNHVIRGELSLTSRIDRVAMTFSLGIGAVRSNLQHFERNDVRWRPIWSFQLGAFFDGTLRRMRRAKRAKSASEGPKDAR